MVLRTYVGRNRYILIQSTEVFGGPPKGRRRRELNTQKQIHVILADVGVRVEVEHANFARFPNRRPPVDVLRNHQSIFLETRHFSPFLTKLQSVPDSKPHLRTPTHHTNDGYKIRSQCLQCLQLLGM